ncbi:mas-related G-protein coupled receptor member X1-like [Passerculus sandwichensis]
MEVTTLSPTPASPTEADDLCETDVTNVAIHSVTLLIGLCGLAGNGAVLWLLSLKGINFFIFIFVVIDFLFLLLTVPSALILLVEDVSCSPILPLLYLRFLYRLSVFSYWVPLGLSGGSLMVWTAILWKLCCHRDLPVKVLIVVLLAHFWAFSAIFTEIPTLTFLCPSNEQEHCQAALIVVWAIILCCTHNFAVYFQHN